MALVPTICAPYLLTFMYSNRPPKMATQRVPVSALLSKNPISDSAISIKPTKSITTPYTVSATNGQTERRNLLNPSRSHLIV